MNGALLVIHVLACLCSINFLPAYGQSTCCPTANCCDNGCSPPTPYNITLDQFVSYQPIYFSFFPAIPLFAGVDNACLTYVSLPDGTYLLTDTTVYSNGYNVSYDFTTSQSDLGVFLVGSSTCNSQVTIFDYVQTDDCDVYLAYVCFFYGSCPWECGDSIPVFGFSSSNSSISQNCLSSAINSISLAGVPDQGYFIAPFNLTLGCTNITCSSGSSC